jgi:hypothetical protein
MPMKSLGQPPLPLPAVLEVLKKRAELKEGRPTPWEEVASETSHSKRNVLAVWSWFKSLEWEKANNLVGSSEEILRLRPDYLEKGVQDLARRKEGVDPVKAKSWEEHHRSLKRAATELADRMKALAGARKPQKFVSEVEHRDGEPVWRPGIEDLAYLEAHLESTPQLFELMRAIEASAGQYIRGFAEIEGGLTQQFEGYDDLMLDESQWCRGLRPSFFAKLFRVAEAKAKRRLSGGPQLAYVIEMEEQQGWTHLIISGTTVALSRSVTELEEWKRLFNSGVVYATERLVPLLRLKQKIQELVGAFSSQVDPVIKAGFFEGTCPVCRLLR